MEDRHYLSEPRPIAGLTLPTWEVDVMREGVDTPIMTLTVDSKALPPRKRKKKIVWKLPDDMEVVPKFGMEDKKRILEIFKKRKKELKRQRKSQSSSGINPDQNGDGGGNDSNSKTLLRKSSSRISDEGNGGKEHSLPNGNGIAKSAPPPGFAMSKLSISNGDKISPSPATPSSRKVSSREPKLKEPLLNGHSVQQESAKLSQPKVSPSAPLHAPRGVPQSASASQSQQPPGVSQLSTSAPSLQQVPRGISPSSSMPIPPPGITNPPPPLRQFLLPENSTMTLGEFVAKSYYYLLANGLVEELCQYYSPTAQKSMTVGGAHACCTQPEERVIQLQRLAAMALSVKGYLQQPTVHESTLVLITGTCVQPHNLAPLPFCHSLVLIPVAGCGYQIQNDALAFLTSEG